MRLTRFRTEGITKSVNRYRNRSNYRGALSPADSSSQRQLLFQPCPPANNFVNDTPFISVHQNKPDAQRWHWSDSREPYILCGRINPLRNSSAGRINPRICPSGKTSQITRRTHGTIKDTASCPLLGCLVCATPRDNLRNRPPGFGSGLVYFMRRTRGNPNPKAVRRFLATRNIHRLRDDVLSRSFCDGNANIGDFDAFTPSCSYCHSTL